MPKAKGKKPQLTRKEKLAKLKPQPKKEGGDEPSEPPVETLGGGGGNKR